MFKIISTLCPPIIYTLLRCNTEMTRQTNKETFLAVQSRTNGIQREIKVKGKAGYRNRYMYLGAVVSHNGSKSKDPSRIAQATAALTKGCQIGEIATYLLGQR